MNYYKRIPIDYMIRSFGPSGWGVTVCVKNRLIRINRFQMAFYVRSYGNITPNMMVSYIKDNIGNGHKFAWYPTGYKKTARLNSIRDRYIRLAESLVESGVLTVINE